MGVDRTQEVKPVSFLSQFCHRPLETLVLSGLWIYLKGDSLKLRVTNLN